jgi:signal transduction histidine kinase
MISHLIFFSIFLLNGLLGFVVLNKNPRHITHRTFAFLVGISEIWLFAYYWKDEPLFKNHASLLLKLDFASGIFLCAAFYLFSQFFPQPIKLSFLKKISILILVPLFSILSFTPLILKNIHFRNSSIDAEPGFLFFGYSLLALFFIEEGLRTFITKYRHLVGIERRQISYVLLGLVISASILSFVNLILGTFYSLSERVYRLSSTSFLAFIIFTSLAIVRYHLFGIRVLLTELLVGLMGIVLFLQIIFTQNLQWRISSILTFLLFLIFAYYLVKSVHEEERRREEAEKLAQKEREIAEKYQVLAVRLMAVEKSLREIAERERALRESAEKLSQAKTEFIAIVSHQLRTPLTIISGYLSMIFDGDYGEIPPKLKEIIKKILQSTQRLICLVNSILDVSKIEAGEMEINFERVDLREIAREVMDELKMKAQKKNLYLELKEPKEKMENLVDREKIREVLFNLVDNAIKYTQEGGITLSLKRVVEKNVDQICVRDTGEGLTKEEREKIFERFSRGRAGLKFWTEGVGLGLFISKSFVEMHGGRIWVESEGKGKGSTFYIELPIKN